MLLHSWGMRLFFAVAVALALVLQPASARATIRWQVDNTCAISQSGNYFYLGGSLAGWHIHRSGGYNNCHLYNFTTASSLPVSWANYLLEPNEFYDGVYKIRANILCHHNAPRYKYYLLQYGTGAGVTEIHTTQTHMSCGYNTVVPGRYYCAQCGASIRLVDNVAYAAEPQNADLHIFDP